MKPLPLYKFCEAIEMLATSSRSLQDRLHAAQQSISSVRPEDLPNDELGSAYADFISAIAPMSDASTGAVADRLLELTDEEAEDVADKLFSIYLMLRDFAATSGD